ncbi:hypothetical protein CHLNCDRAFT_143954 [Chlorella variabilis]|uniref:Uncharacterized protein n=1 Tax=Chlorella variabilis TaxID=554065 RepID=E1ZAT8_CHLVA|nr:hypothetical protein CHLNCDRAFT_143954 [Chlorella variabilis]EFN57323.1 hypothetical protein CHLNCDRAFT_143954 [Chlorella variabilis]|eukprot:XP_005849425.1 hypothetical protein CHLNCDRAFT_143954 [Chlorella variabilis]
MTVQIEAAAQPPVAAAAREVELALDMRGAPGEHLHQLLPLLTTLALRSLLLAPSHAHGAEALLRCDSVTEVSAATLRVLGASVACTDTLQRYSRLEQLHLDAGVLERLYPAVLHDMAALVHLGLHGYKEVELSALPPSVLEVTPRPEAMRCQLAVRLPPGMRLRRLAVHGSFPRLLSTKAAPKVCIDTQALCRQCEHARIEAREAVWQLPPQFKGHFSQRRAGAEAALAAALLDAQAAWSRLELHLLERAFVEEAMPPEDSGPPTLVGRLDLERLVEAVLRLGRSTVAASLRRESVSIFNPWVLVLERGRGPIPAQDAAL